MSHMHLGVTLVRGKTDIIFLTLARINGWFVLLETRLEDF